jgi:hypothetical protein
LIAGMGLDARMIRDADRKQKDRLGVLAYFIAACRNLGHGPIRYAITIDGRRFYRRAKTVLIANLGKVTAGLDLVPSADPEDGVLDVAILRARTFWDVLRVAGLALIGRHVEDRDWEVYQGRDILIETATPQPVQIDGNELPPTTRLHARVEPRALRLVRPRIAEAEVPLVARPVVAHARNATAAWSLLVGAAATTAFHFRAQARRGEGGRLSFFERHPLLSGLAAAALVRFFPRRSRPDPFSRSPQE